MSWQYQRGSEEPLALTLTLLPTQHTIHALLLLLQMLLVTLLLLMLPPRMVMQLLLLLRLLLLLPPSGTLTQVSLTSSLQRMVSILSGLA